MSIFSMEHLYDGWEQSVAGKLSLKMAKKISKLMSEEKKAEFYLQGCSYYLVPIYGNRYGFGSGNLELVFETNDISSIQEKLFEYFDTGFSKEIMYGGCDVTADSIKSADETSWEWKEIFNCNKEMIAQYEDDNKKVTITAFLAALDHKIKFEVINEDKLTHSYRQCVYETKDEANKKFREYCAKENNYERY